MPQVIYITCTMAAWDFADIYTRSPRACGPRALGVYISKIPRSHDITITCAYMVAAGFMCSCVHLVVLTVHVGCILSIQLHD